MPALIFPSEMPDFPNDRLDAAGTDFLYLLSVMCHPHDSKARLRMAASIDAHGIYSLIEQAQEHSDKAGSGEVGVSAALVLHLRDAPNTRAEIGAATESGGFNGPLAGLTLGWILSSAQNPATKPQASLHAAFAMIEEGCRKGRLRGGGRENMKQHVWPRFRSVAHLWAAWHVMSDQGVKFGPSPAGRDIHMLLMIAESFRRKGERFVPPHGRAAILPAAETWKVRREVAKDWPKAEVVNRGLDAWDLRVRVKLRE